MVKTLKIQFNFYVQKKVKKREKIRNNLFDDDHFRINVIQRILESDTIFLLFPINFSQFIPEILYQMHMATQTSSIR